MNCYCYVSGWLLVSLLSNVFLRSFFFLLYLRTALPQSIYIYVPYYDARFRVYVLCSYHRVSEFIVHMIHYNNYKSSKVRPKRSGIIIINLLQRRVSFSWPEMKRSPFWSTLTSVITLPIWYAITVVGAGYKFTPKTIVLCHLWCIKYW